jgi:hypothetical protein
MFASRSISRAIRLARGLSSAAVSAPTMDEVRGIASKNKEIIQVVGTVFASVGVVGGAVIYATGWKGEAKEIKKALEALATKEALAKVETAFVTKEELARVETEVKNLATKESVGKVETELKSLATKEELAKVGTSIGKAETKVESIVELARSAGENAALRAWKEKEASGGKASLG